MRMRKKKNLVPRMEAHADRLIENPYAMPGTWRELLNVPVNGKETGLTTNGTGSEPGLTDSGAPHRAILLEVGCGKGRFTAGLAAAHPDALVVGLEIVPEAIVVAMERCANLPNAFFIRAGAEQLPSFFDAGEVDAVYLNFSDPWPSNRHAKRRLTHGNFLKLYRQILRPGGQVAFKTDNAGLFDFSVEEFPRYGFTLSEVTRNLHKDGPVGIMTDYEAKFHAQGIPICRLLGTMDENWVEPYPETAKAARKRWLSAFAAKVPAAVLREHVTSEGNFLWHIFTWGKVPCLSGERAREELAKLAAEGADAFLFTWEYATDGVPTVRHIGTSVPENLPDGAYGPFGLNGPAGLDSPAGLDGADWYLTDQQFTWTYVQTHEPDCGPYFCRADDC